MPRVKLKEMDSESFLREVKARTGLSYTKLAGICGVHRRSFSDWGGGKILMPEQVFHKLLHLSGVRTRFKVLPDYWHSKEAARKGGLKRNALHGNPGTAEGRSLGGKTSYERFLANPDLVKKAGFVLEKEITCPDFSAQFAELIGIILGDGGISPYQLIIALHYLDDLEYSQYVRKLIKKVLGVWPSVYKRDSVVQIIVSRTKLIKFLSKLGLAIGSKVRQQIGVPDWIEKTPEFTKACLRGLMDTDGCFYLDHHRYKDRLYLNPALNFTNRSLPILQFSGEVFWSLAFTRPRRHDIVYF